MTSNQSAEPHGTYLVLGLLIAAGAVMFLWLAPRNQEAEPSGADGVGTKEFAPSAAADTHTKPVEGPPKPAPAPEAAPQVEPLDKAAKADQPAVAQPPKASEHVDLFATPLPESLDRIYKRVSDNKWLSAGDQKQLYEYGKEHKDDARPQLMLAWDARNRDWDGIAARMYRIAFSADARAKDDPSMLPDLISIAGRYDNVEYTDSSSLIVDAFGSEALPEVEDEIALATRRGEQRKLDRLTRLRDAIRAH